jgi:DNA-binding CsgD family transcriptional regulator
MTFEQRVTLMKSLSATEIEVLQNFADGLGTAEIAASRKTTAEVIKNYTYRACQKLGADNRAHLIAVAFRQGLIKMSLTGIRFCPCLAVAVEIVSLFLATDG